MLCLQFMYPMLDDTAIGVIGVMYPMLDDTAIGVKKLQYAC